MLFAIGNRHLQAQGLKIGRGTIVDAAIPAAPSLTKNQDKKRDPEMCQTKRGNQWYFGMKAHIGMDSRTKSKVRARVEQLFHMIKQQSGFVKVRYPLLA